jgi:coproporphyrinogen III oxidase-like Fe-S oxidoreductase
MSAIIAAWPVSRQMNVAIPYCVSTCRSCSVAAARDTDYRVIPAVVKHLRRAIQAGAR